MLHKNQRRGQIAETVTWLVATVVILVILSMAIYTASVLSKTNRAVTISADEAPILLKKSLYGYLFSNDSTGEKVFTKLEKNKVFDSFSEELGKKVFKDPSGKLEFSLKLASLKLVSLPSPISPEEEIRINKDLNLEVVLSDERKATATI